MSAYYNEIDPYAAQWLRNLIAAGVIADGEVDERSIEDVRPSDITGFTQCHFFAGIGIWSHALRLAGWSDDRPVWTGSCPCQPFSAAGKGGGFDDERHLWPAWFHLIKQCRPTAIFGEQVASKDGLAWFDLVQADLEGTDYIVGAADMCAAGVGAPHIRQRLWWYARQEGLDYAEHAGLEGYYRDVHSAQGRSVQDRPGSEGSGDVWLADNNNNRRDPQTRQRPQTDAEHDTQSRGDTVRSTNPTNGFWRDVDWLGCRDGKFRPVRPGTFPLVDGATGRVGRLRAYGNGIVPQAAQKFIETVMEYRP